MEEWKLGNVGINNKDYKNKNGINQWYIRDTLKINNGLTLDQ